MAAPKREWEEVLNAYLEGRGLRADAEDLLLRLNLAPDDRDEIERVLHLADELSDTARRTEPPADLAPQLIESLRACAPPTALPAGWAKSAGGFLQSGPIPEAEEEIFDRAAEGLGTHLDTLAHLDSGRATDAGIDELEVVNALAIAIEPVEADPAMEARCIETLRKFMDTEMGEVDERVVERLLGNPKQHPPATEAPDVIAAEENPPDDDEPSA